LVLILKTTGLNQVNAELKLKEYATKSIEKTTKKNKKGLNILILDCNCI
jgi:hypothetical protein